MNEMVVREAKTVLKNTFRQLRKEGWFARMNMASLKLFQMIVMQLSNFQKV